MPLFLPLFKPSYHGESFWGPYCKWDCSEKARICFGRWRCPGVEHSWVIVLRDTTVDGASERHRQSSERQRQQPWKANGKRRERTDRGEGESYDRKSESDEKKRLRNKIQGANGPTLCLFFLYANHPALKGTRNCKSGQCVSPVPVARGQS